MHLMYNVAVIPRVYGCQRKVQTVNSKRGMASPITVYYLVQVRLSGEHSPSVLNCFPLYTSLTV